MSILLHSSAYKQQMFSSNSISEW